jgi:hypothetical protein
MPSATDFLSSYLDASQPGTPNPFLSPAQSQVVADTANKQAEVAQVTDQKRAELAANTTSPAQAYLDAVTRFTGKGLSQVPTQRDADIISLSPQDLISKYGVQQGMAMVQSQLQGAGGVQADQASTRSWTQAAGDMATGAALGFGNSLASIAALGAGAISPAAGVGITQAQNKFNSIAQDTLESDALAMHKHLASTTKQLGLQDNAVQEVQDAKTDGAFVAGLKRLGNDAMTAVGSDLSDPTVLSDNLANGAGMLLSGGPIAKGVGAVAKPLVGAIEEAGYLGKGLTGAKNAAAMTEDASHAAANGLMFGGGNYQDAVNNVMGMSDAQLRQNSPTYVQMVGDDPSHPKMDPDQAKQIIANKAGLFSAAVQAPAAMLAGQVSRSFMSDPLAAPSLPAVGANMAKEATSLGVQSGTGALATNLGIQQSGANPGQDLLDNVGAAAGSGALTGALTAGALQGPGAAALGIAKGAAAVPGVIAPVLKGTAKVAGAVASPVLDLAAKKGAAAQAANEAASPVSDQNVAQAADDLSAQVQQQGPAIQQSLDEATANAPVATQDEVKAYSKQVSGMLRFDPQLATQWGLPESAYNAIKDSPNLIRAMQTMGAYVKDDQIPAADRLTTAQVLQSGIEQVANTVLSRPDILNAMGPEHPFNAAISEIANLHKQLEQSPLMKGAGEAKDELVDQVADKQGDVTEESAKTPEGQQAAQNVAAMATLAPEKVHPEVADTILKMEAAGQIELTDKQRAALQSVGDVLKAQQAGLKQMAAEGRIAPNADGSKSTGQVAADVALKTQMEGKESALDHAKGVREAYDSGNTDLARQRLDDLGAFARSQQEKVSTLNGLLDEGKTGEKNAVHRIAATPGRGKGFFLTNDETSQPIGITPHSQNSVDLAQRISGEARMLTDLHNHLADAYPDLGAKPIEHTDLHPLLSGSTAKDIADEFKSGVRQVPGTVDEAGNRTELKQADGKSVDEWRPSVRDIVKTRPTDVLKGLVKGLDKQSTNENFDTRQEAFRQEARAELDRRANAETPISAPGSKEAPAKAEAKPVEEVAQPEQKVAEKPAEPMKSDAEVKAEEDKLTQEGKAIDSTPVEKPAAEPAAAAEPEAPVEAKKAMPTASEAAKGEPAGVAKSYPNLAVPKAGNKFLSAFKLPKTRRSNLQGEESPLSKVAESLSTQEAFNAAAGKNSGKRTLDEQARRDYRQVFKGVANMVKALNVSVADFLNSENKAGQSKLDGFKSGEISPQRWRAGKLLNLVEEQPDGSFKLNQGLAESAGLAAMQWVMSSRSRNGNLDERDAAEALGMDVNNMTSALLNHMRSGVARDTAYGDLATKILSYWGLARNGKEDISYTQGIPQAMAAELVEHLEKAGFLKEVSKRFDMDTGEFVKAGEGEGRNVKDVTVLQPAKLEEFGKGIRAFPDAIERVVNTSPELSHYLGDARPDIPRTQMNNPTVENSTEQVHMLENESDTPYKANLHVLGLYDELGTDFFVDAYGPGQFDESKLNKQDLESKKGQRLSITSAFDAIKDLVTQMGAHADDTGVKLGDVEVRFPHNMSKVGRMQQVGAVTPQSSKAMREAILPTDSKLNLGKKRDKQAFMLGIGQAVGVKVHNMPFDLMREKTQALLDGPLKPAVDVLRAHLNGEKMTAQMRADLAASLKSESPSFQQFHALTEYARYLNADKAERKAFQTKMYLEADGMTNGPLMAMMLFTRGNFTASFLRKVAMGGIYVGTEPKGAKDKTLTSTVQRANTDGPIDMYGAVSDDFAANIKRIRDGLGDGEQDKAYGESLDHVLKLMNLMLGDKFVNFNDQSGDPEFGRDVAKNPMTTTLYGAGKAGIASKLLGMLTDKIYQQMSDASVHDRGFGDLFNGDAAKQKIFQDAMQSLTGRVWSIEDGEKVYKDQALPDNKSTTPQDYELNSKEIGALHENIKTLFVEPLRQSIENVIGDSLMESFDLVRQATQAQSIVNAEYYRKAVDAALAKKQASGDYAKGEYLSQDELNQITASLKHLAPVVHAPGQTFSIGSTLKTLLTEGKPGAKKRSPVEFAAALDDNNRVQAKLEQPTNIGVKALASLNIGMGDGKMMQLISTMKNAITGTLKIFDGMNMPLDKIDLGSEQANESVWNTLHGNPLRDVHTSFSDFLKNDPIGGIEEGSQAHSALVRALFGPGEKAGDYPLDAVRSYMGELSQQLDDGAREVTARQQTLDTVNTSTDQMAAASAPHQIQDREAVDGTPEEQATRLSEIYFDKLEKLQEEAPEKPRENISPELAAAGTATPSGARDLSMTALGKLTQQLKLKIPKTQADLINQIQKSLAAAGFRVIYGTREQLLAHNRDLGGAVDATLLTDPKISGFTRIGQDGTGQIWMVSPSSETLTHELVHAATMKTVQAYYAGEHLGANHEIIAGAIQNMEKLQAQFLSLGDQVERGTPRLQRAFANAKAAILGRLNDSTLDTATQKAQGLNEFMAWALSNQQLTRLQQRTEANPLVRLAQQAIDFLKQIVWGKKVAPQDPGNDMFSNLMFNASLVVRSQPTMQDVMHDTTMMQSAAYGHSDDLTQKDQAFDRAVTDWLKEVPSPTVEFARRLSQATDAVDAGAEVALHFATRFPMTLQEQTTFSKVVAALATEARFDPNVMAEAQKIWSTVSKQLTPEMLMDKQAAGTDTSSALWERERGYGQERLNALLGNDYERMDAQKRSTLLPAFLALYMTHEPFQQALDGMKLPALEKSHADNLPDRTIENVTGRIMDSFTRRISGVGQSDDVRASMDALSKHFNGIAQNRESFADTFLDKTGSASDGLNAKLVSVMNDGADAVVKGAEALHDKFGNRFTEALASSTRILAAFVSQDHAGHVSDGFLKFLNQGDNARPFRELARDAIGRTKSNAPLFDMISTIHAWVHRVRQEFRDVVPETIAGKFSEAPSDETWSMMHRAMGRAELASLAQKDALDLMRNPETLKDKTAALEEAIHQIDPANAKLLLKKSDQLADYMMNGKTSSNLLRNATAIASLFNEKAAKPFKGDRGDLVKALDQLVTHYAYGHVAESDRQALSELMAKESDGMQFVLSSLQGQYRDEQSKAMESPMAMFNHYKGFVPTLQDPGSHLVVADDAEHGRLTGMGYSRMADYQGSSAEHGKTGRGYYYLPVSGRAPYEQGLMQNIRQSAGGVDVVNGRTLGMTAGRIVGAKKVAQATEMIRSGYEKGATEHLMPVFNQRGEVVAYERSLDPALAAKVENDTRLHKMLGVWQGRQVEEFQAKQYNNEVVGRLGDMYAEDLKKDPTNQSQYVNLFSAAEQAKDPVLADAMKLITPQVKSLLEEQFGKNQFWVRRELVTDVAGVRKASVGDPWTGVSRWSDETQAQVRQIAMSVFGNKAFVYMTKAEQKWQNLVSDVRGNILIKSLVVPFSNMISDTYQMISRGVPVKSIVTGFPRKTAEVQAFVKSEVRRIEAGVELRAAQGRNDRPAIIKLQAEIQAITDSHKRLSIWPLLEAGQFSSVTGGHATHEDVELTSGKLYSWVDSLVNKLPGAMKTAGRYALLTKDTALYQGIEKALDYSVFLSKAVYYDDLMRRQGMNHEQAMDMLAQTFTNHVRLRGRFRSYMENMGMAWFYNYKIRAAQVAMSTIRQNPFHALVAGLTPAPSLFGTVGSAISDNFMTQAVEGRIGPSIGLGELVGAPIIDPLLHLF